jgi:cytokinesis protein
MDNQSFAEQKAAADRRKQQVEDAKAARVKAVNTATEDSTMLDSLLEKLRSGESVKGRTGKTRRGERQKPGPSPLTLPDASVGDTADIAKGMLAALKSDGFDPTSMPSSPTSKAEYTRSRRARIRSDPELAEEIALAEAVRAAGNEDAEADTDVEENLSAGPLSPTPKDEGEGNSPETS